MNINEFLELIEYKVAEGSEYYWECFGPNAWSISRLDYNETSAHASNEISVVFDTKTSLVYSIEALNYQDELSYQWIHPDYEYSYNNECLEKDVNDYSYNNIEWLRIKSIDEIKTIVKNLLEEK